MQSTLDVNIKAAETYAVALRTELLSPAAHTPFRLWTNRVAVNISLQALPSSSPFLKDRSNLLELQFCLN
jgi:hypothetical protein